MVERGASLDTPRALYGSGGSGEFMLLRLEGLKLVTVVMRLIKCKWIKWIGELIWLEIWVTYMKKSLTAGGDCQVYRGYHSGMSELRDLGLMYASKWVEGIQSEGRRQN